MSLINMLAPASGQEVVCKVLLENAEVMVIETTYPIGTSVPMHEHRSPHVVYVVEGGTVQTTAPDGDVGVLELCSGQTLWRQAQSHSTRNVGSTTVKVVEVEVRGAAR